MRHKLYLSFKGKENSSYLSKKKKICETYFNKNFHKIFKLILIYLIIFDSQFDSGIWTYLTFCKRKALKFTGNVQSIPVFNFLVFRLGIKVQIHVYIR